MEIANRGGHHDDVAGREGTLKDQFSHFKPKASPFRSWNKSEENLQSLPSARTPNRDLWDGPGLIDGLGLGLGLGLSARMLFGFRTAGLGL